AGEQVVDRGELAGHADRAAHRVGVGGEVVAGDVDAASVRTGQRGQDVHGGGLAGAVRAEQGECGAGRHGDVDAVEHELVADGLAQPGGGDRHRAWRRRGYRA